MTSLYEISTEYRNAAETLSEMDLDAQTVADTLEGLSGDLEVKAQNVIFFAKNMQATISAIKDAEERMATRRKAMENRAKGLMQYVLTSMQVAGVEKIECPFFKLSIQSNPAAVEIYEPGLIPSAFMTKPLPPEPAPDKEAIKKAIKDGQEVPGARLSAGVRLAVR